MTTKTRPEIRARLTLNSDRIVISGGHTPDLREFYDSLPSMRRSGADVTCRATPIAARRIQITPLAAVSVGPTLGLMAEEASEKVRRAPNAAAIAGWLQPAMSNTTPWRHQIEGYWFADSLDACLLAMDMGTGKSKVAVDLIVNWDAFRVLILCPKSVMGVWRREFAAHAARDYNVIVLDRGTVPKKTQLAALEFEKRAPLVIVINYESAWRKAFAAWSLDQKWCVALLDESHRVKGHGSAVSKYVAKLGRRARRRLCLTGTPMPHSPLDLFGQFRFLDPGVYGDRWTQFRARYAKMQNPSIPQMITGFRNQDELKQRMAWLTYRVGDEVLDLPPVQHHTRTFELKPTAMKHYRELEQEMITEVESGVCTVANCLVKSIRLRQATSGHLVEDDTGRQIPIDDGRARLLADLLVDLGAHEPVAVFAQFRYDLDRIREVVEASGRQYGEVSGRHKNLTADATMPDDIDVLGLQYQSGGVGIDTTRARYVVYYSSTYSLGDYEQSLKRSHRPGQDRPVNYYHLVADGTIDVAVRKALESKKEVVDVVMDVFKQRGGVA